MLLDKIDQSPENQSQRISYIKCEDANGDSPLMLLCENPWDKILQSNVPLIVKVLIDRDASVNHVNPKNNWTALHQFCRYYPHDNLLEIIQLLVDNRIDVNAKNSDGLTALPLLFQHYTHADSMMEILQLLVDEEERLKVGSHWSSLHYLCRYYCHDNLYELVRLLVCEKEINVNLKNPDGWTALMILCRNSTHNSLDKIVRFLVVEKRADVKATESNTRANALTLLQENYPDGDKKNDIIQILMTAA